MTRGVANLRTITFDDEQWQVVPKQMTEPMRDRLHEDIRILCDPLERTANIRNDLYVWSQVLAAAPEPPVQPEVPMRDLLAEAREQVEALDRENHKMRRCVARLMARLTVWLDDDQFNEADGIMYPEFEPPAQQPMSRDREVWRAALTLANNICVQESDRYNGDDKTHEASATSYCAQRIRDWIAPTDEQLAEMLDEAGIGKGESNE